MPAKKVDRGRRPEGEDTYFRLVRDFPLRPIRSDEDLDRAIAVVDSLVARGDLDPGQQDYLEVLASLVEDYESSAIPMRLVADADMLRHLIEARGETQAQVAVGSGVAESTLSEVLTGKRKLNRRHIGALAAYFHVSPAVFEFGG